MTAAPSDRLVFDLARPMVQGMPQSPNHPPYRLAMPRRHGDVMRADGGSAANDLLVTGTHVGTHIDALGHVSHCGLLYGGVPADEAQRGGCLASHDAASIPLIVARAVLLDVPRTLGVEALDGGQEITVEHLEAALEAGPGHIGPGDVVLVRSGWGRHWSNPTAFVGRASGVPGVAADGAAWLAAHGPVAVGADTLAFERIAPGAGHALLPAHRILLVEHGIYIIECMDLDPLADHLAAHGPADVEVVVNPLALVGATGSPVRPLALVAAAQRCTT